MIVRCATLQTHLRCWRFNIQSMIHNSVMMCSLRVCIVHLCLIKCAGFFNNYEDCGGFYAGAS